jgi:hypothetical protein
MALRIVRSKFPPKQIPPVGRAKTAKKEKLLPVYVAEQNRLATRYLIEILAENRGLQALTLEDLIVHKSTERIAPVFVVDRGGIDLPLSECFHILRERYPEARFAGKLAKKTSTSLSGIGRAPRVRGRRALC